jgi:outer membrane protein assembly factor BamB
MGERTYHTRISRQTAFLVLTILFAGFLLSCGSPVQTASPAKSSPTSSKSTPSIVSTVKVHVLPTPSAQPVNAAATNGNSTQLTIVDGIAYVGTVNNTFYALRVSDGSLLWHAKIDGAVDEPPVVTGGVVYFSTYVGQSGPANVYALRASDGKLLWEYHAGNTYVPTPVVTNGLVYINAPDGVVALQASDGTQEWHFAAGNNAIISSVVNGVLYLSSHEGNSGPGTAYALRASDGSLLWSYKSSKTLDAPEVINGVAYVGTWDGTLSALQASDGKLLWHTTLVGPSLWIQQTNDVLYVAVQKVIYPTTSDSAAPMQALAVNPLLQMMVPASKTIPQKQILTTLYALRTSDGSTLWRSQLNNGTDSFANWFVVDNGIIYGNENINPGNNVSQSYVYAIRGSDSSLLWKDEIDVSAGSAQLANGIIYVTSGNGLQDETTLYALRESAGSLFWSYPIASQSTNTPILVGSVLYIGADNGMVYALSASTGKLLWHYQTAVSS